MAPVASHDPLLALRSLWSTFNENIVKRNNSIHVLVKRDTPVAGFAAAIAVLSAIIIGYLLYRTFKWLRRRQAVNNGSHLSPSESTIASKRMKQGAMMGEVSIPGAQYDQFRALTHEQGQGQSQNGLLSPPSTGKSEFAALNTPKFESRHAPFHPDLEGAYSSYPLYPAQTYSSQGKKKEAGFGGFVKNVFRGKQARNEEAYRMVDASSPSPMKSPPLQFAPENHGMEEQQQQRAGSMPLPPLPPPTPDIANVLANTDANVNGSGVAGTSTSHRHSRSPSERSVGALSNTAASVPHSRRQSQVPRRSTSRGASSQPLPQASQSTSATPSRSNTVKSTKSIKSMRTIKSSRFTSTTMGKHSLEIAVPSPRVSSLYRSRLSLAAYTPASPNLPPPQVPPVPAIPAHLSALSAAPSSFRGEGRASSDLPANKSGIATNNNTLSPNPTTAPPFTALDVPTHGPDGKPLPRTMVVIATFTPSLSDELPVTLGEPVNMLEEYIDGWCFVQRVKITDSRSKLLPIDQSKVTSPASSTHATLNGNEAYVQVPMKTEPVVGDGHSGAIPRFCLVDWPASPSMLEGEQGDESEEEMEEDDLVTTEGAVNPFEPEMAKAALPPSSFKASQQVEKQASRFSSWGSERPLLPSLSFQKDVQEGDEGMMFDTTPSTAGFIASQTQVQHADHDRMTHIDYTLPPLTEASHSENSTNISFNNPSMDASRTTSISTATSSLPPPIPPQSSPVSNLPSSEHLPMSSASPSEDRTSPVVRRISKPPPAPRLSRFPASPNEDSHLNRRDEDEEPFMGGYGTSLASPVVPNRRGQEIEVTMNMGMAIPKASERTMTLPPLPRPSVTEMDLPWNVAAAPLPTAGSATSSGPSTGGASSGTSAGSQTPYTAATSGHARSNSQKNINLTSVNSNTSNNNANSNANANPNMFGAGTTTKRFTSAEAREPRTGGVGGPRQAPASSRSAKNGINAKAFRTGSSIAGAPGATTR